MGNSIASASPDVMGGTPVFPGTRVPVQTLLDYIEAGDNIDDFLEGFPSVSREQVITFLKRGAALAVETGAGIILSAYTGRWLMPGPFTIIRTANLSYCREDLKS